MQLVVDVISDVLCPWCYIGKRRMEKAIAAMGGGVEITPRWLAYQLNPTMPKEGVSRKEYRTRKFGSWKRSQELDAHVAEVGRSEGIDFAFDRIERTPNTLDAHRLIWLADQQGCQDKVVEALFKAYFVDGRDISKPQTLVDVVVGAGLEPQSVETLLNSGQGMDAITEAAAISHRYQMDGVPYFIINGQFALAGAQPPSAFLDAFRSVDGGA